MGSNHKHSSFRQAGFSLIEIMVGLVIGLLTMLVIMQVFSVFEGQKRTTTGAADTQTNGSIALFNIARELQMAGYGLFPLMDSPLECTSLNIAAPGIGGMLPVAIIDGASGASDSITIRYGSSDSGGIPNPIGAAGAVTTVDNNMGCQGGNVAFVINGTACAITSVSSVSGTTSIELNPNPPQAVNGADIACLGMWNEVTYSVSNGNLERNGVPVIAGIVNIQAQYGVANTPGSRQITSWVDADAAGIWAGLTVANPNRNLIRGVRIAVVARSGLLEKEDVSLECTDLVSNQPVGVCAWSGSSSGTVPPSPAPKVTLSGTDWQRYRYRVFETIVPLRNMIWSSRETL